MRFRVENLGPLREAEVDLNKKLIVLTGPNNTGKTYFSTAVYGYSQTPVGKQPIAQSLTKQAIKKGTFSISEPELGHLIDAALRARTDSLQAHLDDCFGASDGSFSESRVIVSIGPEEMEQAISSLDRMMWALNRRTGVAYLRRVRLRPRRIEFALTSDAIVRDIISKTLSFADAWAHSIRQTPEVAADIILRRVRTAIAMLLRQIVTRPSQIFSADRITVNLFAREITARINPFSDDEVGGPNGASVKTSRVGWPLRDAVEAVLRLPEDAKRTGEFHDLATWLEGEVVGGTVGVSRHGAATFTPAGTQQAIDVQQCASVVKSLASVVLYLRHRAQPGDFLIIDEPELNLHLGGQSKVARFLARAVGRGLRVLISTHSDYLLRELNILIQLGRADERAAALVRELDYPKDALLQPADVGVYLFQNGTAKEVEVTEEGFDVKTIDDEIDRTNTVQQKIYSAFLD